MRHRIAGKRLSRTTSHRRALRRNLAASLIEHGAVRTTPIKAKEVRPFVERLITIARAGTLHARRRVIAMLGDRAMIDKEDPEELADQSVVQRLFDEVAPRYLDRPGGYTRIIHLPERRIGDASEQVLLQLVEETAPARPEEAQATASRRRQRAARRADHARAVVEDTEADEEEVQAEQAPEQAADEQEEAEDSKDDQADEADEADDRKASQ